MEFMLLFKGFLLFLKYVGCRYQQLGEKYAEVYSEIVLKGNKDWQPLQPTKV
jgi:hypothetical protein